MARESRVLVVDDQAAMAEMVVDGLTDHGFDARFVLTAEDATRKSQRENTMCWLPIFEYPVRTGSSFSRCLGLRRRRSPSS